MNLLKRGQAVASTNDLSFAPIVQAFTSLSEDERGRLRHKFDIAYFIAIEKLSFRKYSAICELEACHGVKIGEAYTNDVGAKNFIHYIAESWRNKVVHVLENVPFLSLLLDGQQMLLT